MDQSLYCLGFTTLTAESNVPGLPVQGTIPPWLTGTLIRTGPARFEVGQQSYNHWFDGLAMLHRFGIDGGRVSYSNRFLQSQSYREAISAGKISRPEFATDPCRTLFQRVVSWFTPRFTDNGCVNVAQWNDAFVALTETRLPVRFDPQTLATIGLREYAREVKGPTSSAHPHYDRHRHCHYSHVLDFGFQSKYRLFSIDAAGGESVLATITVDRPAYLHSIGMTSRYLILAEFPLVVNPLKLLFSNRPFIRNYEWHPERGVRFHVIDKQSGQVTRRADTAAFFAFHHANAFEDGDDIILDIVIHPDSTVIDKLYLDRLRSSIPICAAGKLTRFRITPTGSISSEPLSDALLELPRFAPHRAGLRYSYLYGASQLPTGDFFDRLVKFDLDNHQTETWHEPGCYPGEPIFVARPNSDEEDDGVILSILLEPASARSSLLILDAHTFTELARTPTPHHIPFSFHGDFFPEAH